MDQQLTQEIDLLITGFYEKVVTALLNPANYSNHAKTDNVKLYLDFVEASLKKSYGRIVHIHTFLSSTLQLMTDSMYPFCHLKESAKEQIKRLHYQAHWLMNGLEEYDSEAAEVLGLEVHELLAAQVSGYSI